MTGWRGQRIAPLMVATALAVVAGNASASAQAPSVGSGVGNPAVLARLFSATCLESESLLAAQSMLARAGMVPNPETGTYFHQQLDMSVNPSGALCSMVFSVADAGTAADVFRGSAASVLGPRADEIEIRELEGNADTYFRASVEAQW